MADGTPYRLIQVGTGGRGRTWCRRILPPFVSSGRIEVVAAVDLNPDAWIHAQEALGVPAERCYTDLKQALDENEADICTVVVPPAAHEQIVDAALAHDMHILSEKPISDTLEGSLRIDGKVRAAGRKMGVTMSHRFRADVATLREAVTSGNYGPIDYIICRFTCNLRYHGDWGAAFRYEIQHPLLIEGAVHHLDLLADMGGAPCASLYARTWNPPWSEFAGDSQALVQMTLENGVQVFYEGAKTNATGLNGWTEEYIRCECERATLELDHQRIVALRDPPRQQTGPKEERQQTVIPLLERQYWSDEWLMEQFLIWLDGGPPMPTNVEANLQSMALIMAAAESSRTQQPVAVQEFLQRARVALD